MIALAGKRRFDAGGRTSWFGCIGVARELISFVSSAHKVPIKLAGGLVRSRFLVGPLVVLAFLPTSSPVSAAQPETVPDRHRTAAAAVKLTAPAEVTEGDRYRIRIKVKTPNKFRRAGVQQRVTDVFGESSWENVKKLRIRNRRTLTYQAVAGETDRETYRVVLEPTTGRPLTSKPIAVQVWHWYPLTAFDSYYATEGVADYTGNQFSMNGRAYVGSWYTYGTARSWESRYTLGRSCRTMSGTFGVTDKSADGSSASLQVLAEGTTPVYTSPALAPGLVDTQTLPLDTPYRISIIGTNSSTEKVLAYPAAGDLRFLCTGLA